MLATKFKAKEGDRELWYKKEMLVALTIKIKKGEILKRGGENTARTKLNGDVSLNVFGLKTRVWAIFTKAGRMRKVIKKPPDLLVVLIW